MKRSLLALALVAGCGSDPAGEVREAGSDGDATVADGALDGGADVTIEAAPPLVDSCRGKGAVTNVWLPDAHYCLELYASGLPQARQMAFGPNGDLFVKVGFSVVLLSDTDKDGVIAPNELNIWVTPTGGTTHGVAISGGYVYASSDTTVYRYPFVPGSKAPTGPEEIVVKGMPASGHFTRTLTFDSSGRLYVSVGSAGNTDEAPLDLATRGMIRRFALPKVLPASGLEYTMGEVFASGLRNDVGVTFDALGRAWSVENGRDSLYDPQLGTIANDNPAEELNRLDDGARFFGYPYCWTEFAIDGGLGPGTQWADETLTPAIQKTDSWCRDSTQVHPPAFALQGHAAPLGIVRYEGSSFPFAGDLVVSQHGSSYRTPAIGRILARAHLVGDTVTSIEPLVGEAAADGGLAQGTWNARPVDVRVGPDGAIYFSDDLGGRVFRLGYRP